MVNVYLHRIHAGRLTRSISGSISFTYEPTYVEQNLPALSISLPLREAPYRGQIVKAFFFGELPAILSKRITLTRQVRRMFWNCLPGSFARDQKKRYAGLSERKRWIWLIERGMGTGAIDLHPVHVSPSFQNDETETILDRKTIHQIKADPATYAFVGGKNCAMPVRIDQDDLVLVKGRGSTLSTHFVKHIGDKDRASVELFCMRLARSVGIETPDTEIRYIDGNPCYLIRRYDRIQSDSGVKMLHQESVCQALGTPSGVWLERHGAPGTKTILALLHKYSANPEHDKAQYLSRLIFGYLTGCHDVNGRNVSLVYRDGLPELAPAYDLTVEPSTFFKLPVSIGGIYDPEKVRIQHWHAAVENRERDLLHYLIKKLSGKIEEKASGLVCMMENEGFRSDAFHAICKVISRRVKFISIDMG